MKNKKTNPHKIPVSQAQLDKAKKEATEEAVKQCFLLVANSLLDKHGWSLDDVTTLWQEVEYLSDSVNENYVTWAQLRKVIEQEQGCKLIEEDHPIVHNGSGSVFVNFEP